MSTPALLIDIAFDSPLLESTTAAVYTDVSAYVRGEVHIHRGRNHETQDFEAGTLTLTLSNTDRRFDPANLAGPYVSGGVTKVLPMKKIRVRAQWPVSGGTPVAVWAGYIESWRPRYGEGNIAYVDLECVDAFKIFNLYTVEGPSLVNQRSDARIGVVLDAIGWLAGDRNFQAGSFYKMRVQAQTALVQNALTHMHLVSRTEGGLLYMARNGKVSFFGQDTLVNIGPPSAVFSDDPAGIDKPYADLELAIDDTHIWNYITMTREAGLQQVAQEVTPFPSRTAYGLRRLDMTGLLFEDDAKAASVADLYLRRYSAAQLRAVRMTVDPAVRDVWTTVLGLDLSLSIAVVRTGLLGGTPFNQECLIQAIDWRITKSRWIASFALSPRNSATLNTAITASTVDRWNLMTLTGGWANFGAPETLAGYYKEGDYVYLRGSIVGTNSNGAVAFTLPLGYRPLQRQRWVTAAQGAFSSAQIRVDGDGTIRPSENGLGAGVSTSGFVSIQGSFKVT